MPSLSNQAVHPYDQLQSIHRQACVNQHSERISLKAYCFEIQFDRIRFWISHGEGMGLVYIRELLPGRQSTLVTFVISNLEDLLLSWCRHRGRRIRFNFIYGLINEQLAHSSFTHIQFVKDFLHQWSIETCLSSCTSDWLVPMFVR